MGIAHFAFDFSLRNEGCNRVNNNNVDTTGADQHICNFKGLFTGIGLRNQQSVRIHTQCLCIYRVKSMFSVNERCVTASLLSAGDSMESNGGLTGGFGSVDFDDTTTWQATDAESNIQSKRTGGNHLYRRTRVVAQAHDRALTELLINLRKRYFERLVAVISLGSRHGCILATCHDVLLKIRASPADDYSGL